MNNIKILIVEDNEDLSTMYRLKFEKAGFDTKVSENWFDALALIPDFQPNVILLDIMMPDMDGFETLQVIRNLAPSIYCKIIMFTNLNSKEDIDTCMSLGADAYLLKASTTPKEALEKIHELLGDKEMSQEKTEHTSVTPANEHNCPHCGKDIQVNVTITA